MIYQAYVKYHCDLTSDYRLIDYRDFQRKEDAEKWCHEQWERYCNVENDDPENPIGDLYEIDIQEI